MTRTEEILEEIAVREITGQGPLESYRIILSPKKLASYLATLESSKDEDKDEDLTFEAPLTAQMVDEVLKIYPFKGEEKVCKECSEYDYLRPGSIHTNGSKNCRIYGLPTPPSEEKKCEETFEAANLKGRCKLLEGHEGIHQPELVSPTQEEKKLDYMMSPGNMKQVEAEYKCKCNGPIRCFEHLIFPASPTPPDAWEKLTSYINEQLQESHNEGTYKYDWLYEDILEKIEELRTNP